jgi:tRNA(Ile)-lysidine synthase
MAPVRGNWPWRLPCVTLARDPKTKQAFRVSEFLQRVENAISQSALLAHGQKFLVAVSGGVDSMVLLHALHALAGKYHWQMAVAHFNHRLRGHASDADEKFVRRTAARLRWQFVGGDADVQQFAAQSKLSLEMAARKLRHEFLARAARAHGIPTIALAHQADDQVELFFLRLLRGAGGEGLAGMKWRSPSPADHTVSLVRPLLDLSKAELLAYVRANRIRFRDDTTNLSTDFLRNRIRQELLPLLRSQYQPGLDQTVLRLMDIVGAEAEFVSAAAKNFCSSRGDEAQNKRTKRDPTKIGTRQLASAQPALAMGNFAGLPIAVQRKVLQQQLAGIGLLPDFELVERLRAAADKTVSAGAGLFAVRDAAGNVSCREPVATRFDPAELKLKLSAKEGRAGFGGRQFRWRVATMRRFQLPSKPHADRPAAHPLREFFDADKLGNEIVLRHWRPGDRFQPIGLPSAVKLQDLFVNAKIPPARRRELALAATQTGVIFWVEGLRISEQFKLTPATRRKLFWEFRIA